MGLSRRDWLARALALGAAGTGAGCGVPVAPPPDGKRTTPRRVIGAAEGEHTLAPGSTDPMAAPDGRGDADPFTLGGDVHAFHAGELHEDFDRPQARAAMIGFSRGGASVSMRGIGEATDRATGVRTLRRFEIPDGSGRLEG